MIELSVHDLNKYYGAAQIFHNISFEVKTGERVGLIGQNGCGKTTMMKILMGREDYQGGEIVIRKDARRGYLDQVPVYEDEVTAADILQSAFENIHQIKKQMKKLEEQFEILEGEALDKAVTAYGRLTQEYERLGGYDTETKIARIAEGLEITENMMYLSFNRLSGGEKTRVILAKILLEEPDILLLDEPNNHLDLEAIGWLEGFLKDYRGAVLVISHDRYFLDAVVSKIVELDYDRADIYPGNYSYYLVEKERRFLIDLKFYQNEQKKIERMERQIERYRIWGEMRDSEKMFKRAKELEKRLEKMDTPIKPVLNKRKIRLNQSQAGRTGKLVLETEGLCKSFGGKTILKDAEVNLFYQESACIIGRNGSGKTTLLKMITGELEPDNGIIRLGSQAAIGYLPQQVVYEDEEQTVLEYFSRFHNITTGAARSQLAKVLFMKEDVNKKLKSLSGGEKSRLKLCSLTFTGVNFLILDEPTNHLDIDSREVLEDMLTEFEGTILFVSHDRYFINKVADKIITFSEAGVKTYNGDYSYYLQEYQKEINKKAAEAKDDMYVKRTESNTDLNKRKDMPGGRVSASDISMSERMLEQLEKEIEELEGKKTKLKELMNLFNSDAGKLEELYKESKELDNKLELLYQKWGG